MQGRGSYVATVVPTTIPLNSPSRFTCSDGATLAYEVSGAGLATIIFLHALGGHIRLWRETWRALTEAGWCCIGLDFRGAGESQTSPCEVSAARLARDVIELADFLKLTGFSLVGHSMGGKIAMRAYAAAPARVGALALLGTPGPGILPIGREVLEDLLKAEDRLEYTRTFFQPWFAGRLNAEIDDWIQSIAAFPEWAMWGSAEAALWTDITSVLPREFPPTLIVAGEKDPVYGPDYQKSSVLPYVPGARFKVVAGAGHGLMLEQPAAISSLLKTFFPLPTNMFGRD